MESRGPYLLKESLTELAAGWVGQATLKDDPDAPPVLLKCLPEEPPKRWKLSIELLQGTRCRYVRIPRKVFTDDQGSYLVARWLQGPNLETVRREKFDGRVPVRQALLWLKHCLLALEVLHIHGLIHGDIKPSNLVLNSKEEAVLTDLGALFPAAHAQHKIATPEYLIPDEAKQAGVERDLYAAALTFGALVSGSIPPPPGEKPYLLSETDPLIPEAANALLARAQGFGEPFTSATEMLTEVETLLGLRERKAQDTSPPTRVVEVKKSKKQLALWPLVIALFCFPIGIGAGYLLKPAPTGAPYNLTERTGLSARKGSYRDRDVWQTTILGRPVAGFVGNDEAEGDEPPQARASWLAFVLTEAHLEGRELEFDYRNELEDNCDVWLVGDGAEEKFLFRVTPREKKLFETPAPALARLWSRLIQDTLTLLGGKSTPGKSSGILLLRPWLSQAEILTGGKTLNDQARVEVLERAFTNLKPDLQEEILNSYTPEKND